ncbi:MAG: hypothetical protein MK172_11075 [Verrucomicrobiales bacterium]|nr:hypothetical protein [Verrucomicrobiales bacterium]
MSKRSFNYTKRKRLGNSDFELSLFENSSSPSEFELSIPEDDNEIPDHFQIIVDAYRGSKVMRFGMGTWGKRNELKRQRLTAFDPGENVMFRIKIVDDLDSKRRIAMWRDQIKARSHSQDGNVTKSILPVHPRDLGSIGWKLDWANPARPELQVNSKISEAQDVTSIVKNDPDFAILVFPEVIRQALTKLLKDDIEDDTERQENEWFQFGAQLAGIEAPSMEEDDDAYERESDDWVSDVTEAFGKNFELVKRYVEFKSSE